MCHDVERRGVHPTSVGGGAVHIIRFFVDCQVSQDFGFVSARLFFVALYHISLFPAPGGKGKGGGR